MKNCYLLLLLISPIAFSQTIECGVANVSGVGDEIQRRQTIQQLAAMPNLMNRGQDNIAYVPVKAHLLGEDDDTGYLDSGTVNKALARLNNEFHEINIQFYFSGTDFSRYPNSALNAGDPTFAGNASFANANGHDDAINVYFAKVLLVNGASVGGLSPVSPTQQSQNRIFYRNASVMNGKSFVHEFGHFFGLQHTFNNSMSPSVQNRELVTRDFDEVLPRLSANCELKGDFLCDTPADAYGSPNTDMNFCVYSGTLTDANNDTFSPDLTNYMAYNTCVPYRFSDGQYARMQDGLLILNNPSNTFTLDAPETLQDAPAILAAVADAYGATLAWADNSDVETGYMIERAPAIDGPFKVVAGTAENETMLEHVPAISGEPNFYRIKPSNSKNIYSAVSGEVVSNFYCANYSAQSCTILNPQFPSLIVDDFTLSRNGETVMQNLDSGCSAGGTADYYNAFSTSAAAGEILNFSLSSRQGTNGGVFEVIVNLYADWNKDNDFDDAGELLFASEPSALGVSGNFQIPPDVAAGDYRMRAILTNTANQIQPCYVFNGEMEDYRLSVSSLSTNDIAKSRFVLYPNPVSNVLTITADAGFTIDGIAVSDVYGKMMSVPTNGIMSVDTTKLASGIYFLHILSGDERYVRRFIRE